MDLVANQGLSSGTDTTPGETAAAFNYGFDCIIIPGAQGPGEGNIGTPVATQTSTLLKQTLLASGYLPFSWPPHICGSEGSIGIGSADLVEAALPTVATVEVDAQQQASAVDQTICSKGQYYYTVENILNINNIYMVYLNDICTFHHQYNFSKEHSIYA